MQSSLYRKFEHWELEAERQFVREVDGDEISLRGALAEVVERGLGERARGDDVVGAEEAGGGGGERGCGGGGGVEGEGDARVLPKGF